MIVIESNSTCPYYNFALEYYLLMERPFPNETVLMFWRTAPTVMVGKFQNTYQEVNLGYIKQNQINVVRRLSGGGAIYTDMGSWQFSFITKHEKAEVSFSQFINPVAEALRGLGLDVTPSGRNDLTIDGRKFSGNAQCVKNGYTLHHGSILFDTDIEEMVRSTTVDVEKIVSKGIQSVRERVVNISDYFTQKPTMTEFKQMMLDSITKGKHREYHLTPQETERIAQISDEKFDNAQIIYGASPQCSIVRKKRFPSGGIECHLDIAEGVIKAIAIFGDFFGIIELPALCENLRGCEYSPDAVRNHLAQFYVENSIYQITIDELMSVVIGG